MSDIAGWVASSDGVSVAVRHLAAGDPARPLLVAHATGFNGLAYRAMAEAWAPDFDVWALDVRGHGASAFELPPDGAVEWAWYGDDVAAVANWLADRSGAPLVSFGHSMGGALLLDVATRQPELLTSIAAYEPIVFPPPDASGDGAPNPLVEGARYRRRTFASREAAVENFASKPPMRQFDPEVLRDYVVAGTAPTGDGEEVALTCAPLLEAATYVAGASNGLWSVLPSVSPGIPVTVFAGAPGELPGPALIAPEIAARIPHAEFIPFPHLDHFGPFEAPREVAALVASLA